MFTSEPLVKFAPTNATGVTDVTQLFTIDRQVNEAINSFSLSGNKKWQVSK